MTLLPVISKILLCRLRVDKKLRKEHAALRPKKSTADQIFILEQANEWRAGLYADFVDFENAFDAVYRESVYGMSREAMGYQATC